MADKKTLELQIQVLMQQAQQQIKTFATDIKSAATQIKNLNVNNADVKKSIEAVKEEASRAAKELNSFAQDGSFSIQNLTKEIGTLAAVTAAVSFDKWVIGLASSALDVSTSFRATKEDFGIMLGDMEAGAGLFAELQKFNFWTPFDLDQTSQAAKVLMEAKVPLKDITEYLTRFGDISQGNGQRFQSFINAFSKASAKGKADMEVLNIYIDQGVRILDALGEQMGVTSAEIVDMASKGKVSFQDLDNALASMAAEGGLYYNTMVTASQRLDAMQAGLEESVNALAASFGELLAPMMAKTLEMLTNLVDAINNSPFLKGVFSAALIAVVTIINTQMIRALVAFVAKTWTAYAAQMSLTSALSITNPLLLKGVAVVAAATAGYVAFASGIQKAEENSNNMALAAKKEQEEIQQLNKEYMKFMDNMNLQDAQLTVGNYIKNVIPAAEQAVKAAQEKLDATPKMIEMQTYWGTGSGAYYENPEYKKAEESLVKQKKDLEMYQQRLEEAKKKLTELRTKSIENIRAFGTDWQDKILDGIFQINREEKKSMEELQRKGKELLGDNFQRNINYQKELAALTEFYDKKKEDYFQKIKQEQISQQNQLLEEESKRQQKEKEHILSLHQIKIDNLKKEFVYQKELIRLNLEQTNEGFLAYTKQSFLSQTSDSQLSQLINSSNVAAAGMTMLADGVLDTFLQLESVQKVLNPITTILDSLLGIIEPFINGILKPLINTLETIGEVIGNALSIVFGLAQALLSIVPIFKILEGVLDILAAAFEWFYMNVIYPVGNAIIDVFNGIIELLNKIPFIDIEKFDRLAAIGETAERIAQEMSVYEESIRQKYERQKSSVESLLESQLDSLRTQYELGLINRNEYETQAQKYTSEADRKIYDINLLMEQHLAKIEEYAAEGFTAEQIQLKLPAYATGTSNVASNQIAIVHEGEAIIPKTFAESIRNGEMSLSGKYSRADETAPIVVNVVVQGSVTSENELVATIYNGIATGITTRKYQPLPTGA